MPVDIFNIFRNRDRGTQFVSLKASLDDMGIHYFEKENAIACIGSFSPAAGWSTPLGNAWNDALKLDYPKDTFLQVFNLNHPYIEDKLKEYEEARLGSQGGKAVKVAVANAFKRSNYLRNGVHHRLIESSDARIQQSVCLFTLKVPLKTKSPLTAKGEQYKKFQNECEEFVRLYRKVVSSLKAGGVNVSLLDRHAAMGVMRRWFNMYGPWDMELDDEEFLNEQLFPPGSDVNWGQKDARYVRMEGFGPMGTKQYAGVLSVGRYPGKKHRWHMSYMNDLLGHPSGGMPQPGIPFVICTSIYYPSQDSKQAALKRSHVFATRSDNAVNRKYSATLADRLEGFKIINESLAKGGKAIEVNTSMLFFHEDEDRVEDAMMRMQTYLSSKGFMMYPERYLPQVSFINNLPMNLSAESIKNTHRFKSMTTLEAVHLLPVFDEWQGFGDEMLLMTRRSKLFGYSVYHPSNANYNILVAGEAGSGKTVMVQHLTESQLSLGTKVYTIDTGSNYLASGELKGAAVIDIHKESDLCINPFTKIENFSEEAPALIPILGKMAKPREGLDDYENAIMFDALQSVWTSNGRDMDIDDIVEYLYGQSGNDAEIQHRLARLLSQFTSDKPMGRWFNGRNNFNSAADWTIIELSGFGENHHLRDVTLMMFTSVIKQEMFLSRDGRKRMVVVGEAGDHLDNRSMAEFISKLTAKNRKEDGIAVIEMQSLQQLHQTNYGAVIQGNCYTKILMHQTADALDKADREGWYTPEPFIANMLRSVHTAKGQYSEACIISGDKNAAIVRLVETPENRIIYNTEGPVFKELQRRVRAGEPIENYIQEQAAATYGNGYSI